MARRSRAPLPRIRRPSITGTFVNVGFLALLLVGLILFKGQIADQTARFVDQFRPVEGTGVAGVEEVELAVGVARELVHGALGGH